MDGDLKRGQAPRWMRKAEVSLSASVLNNTSMNTSKLSVSYNQYTNTNSRKTPDKNAQGSKRTPGKSPSRKTITPNKNNKTPSGGDRFIPNRATTNFELGHYMVRSCFLRVKTCFITPFFSSRSAKNSNRPHRMMTRKVDQRQVPSRQNIKSC